MRQIILIGVLLFGALSLVRAQDYPPLDTIADAQTVDSLQNALWRAGKYRYPARPRDMWEMGIHAGHFFTDGDVDPLVPAGYGFGVHLRKSINYAISLRGEFLYGRTRGMDAQITDGFVVVKDIPDYPSGNMLHRSYRMHFYHGALHAMVNFSNLLFHRPQHNWNLALILGLGVNINSTHIDAYDSDGQPYDYSDKPTGDINSSAYRKRVIEYLKDKHDNDFETKAVLKDGAWHLGDDTPMHAEFNLGFSVSHKLSDRVNLSFEHEAVLKDHDLLDGFRWRTDTDLSNSIDASHYTSLRLNINLGDFKDRTQPLYWLNPLDVAFEGIRKGQAEQKFDLSDSDRDGVIDLLDREPNTPLGAPVDVQGRTLDSDGDGVPNYQDREPYSPPGYEIDEEGRAIIPPPPPVERPPEPDTGAAAAPVTPDIPIEQLIEDRIEQFQSDWYLPMIHFDNNSYYIKPEFYPQMYQIATVLNKNPDLKMVVKGFTDQTGSAANQAYNTVLSYNRAQAAIDYLVEVHGIDRDRLVLNYGGSENPVIPNLPDSYNVPRDVQMKQYVNRRVEFEIASPEDKEMERPEGPEAGNPGPGRSIRGNRNSGY